MRALVTYGTKRDGTRGLADMVAARLAKHGAEPTTVDARSGVDPTGFDLVIVGGALYNSRWHKQARRFVRRNARRLATIPTWLFSSGPLDDSAHTEDIPPVEGVRTLSETIGARGHATFGGRLAPDATGFPASAMAKTRSGDWRDRADVDAWVDSILAALDEG